MALGGTRDQRKVSSRARRRLKAQAADTHPTQAESVEQLGKDMGVSTQTMVEQGILLHPRRCASRSHHREQKKPAKVGLGKRNQKQMHATSGRQTQSLFLHHEHLPAPQMPQNQGALWTWQWLAMTNKTVF